MQYVPTGLFSPSGLCTHPEEAVGAVERSRPEGVRQTWGGCRKEPTKTMYAQWFSGRAERRAELHLERCIAGASCLGVLFIVVVYLGWGFFKNYMEKSV